jgi:hypothetical protein
MQQHLIPGGDSLAMPIIENAFQVILARHLLAASIWIIWIERQRVDQGNSVDRPETVFVMLMFRHFPPPQPHPV